ncbi:MAG: hypothetical protein M3290_08225 [Actinomycetota bacterium]|nr:hypothetical protein [Actinomycetota bacterium]
MKRSIAVALLGALMTLTSSAGATAAQQQGGRIVEAPYQTPVAGITVKPADTRAYYYDCLDGIGCALIKVQRGERHVSLEIVDASGMPAWADVYVTPGFGWVGEFCGKTTKPINVKGDAEVLVHVQSGACADGTPAVATHGVVRATFTR